MSASPSAPLSVGAVLGEASRLYRSSLPRAWVPALLFAVIVAAEDMAAAAFIPDLNAVDLQSVLEVAAALYSRPMIVLYALAVLTTLVGCGALFAIQLPTRQDRATPSAAGAIASSFRRLPAMVIGTVLNLIPLALAVALATLPGVTGALLGLLWLLIPCTYLWGRLQLWIVVMFAEDAGVFASLAASWRLMSGRWWLGTTILTLVVVGTAFVSSIALGLGEGAATLFPAGPTTQQIIAQLFAVAAYTFAFPMLSAGWVAVYQQFKLRDASGGFGERLEAARRTV